jgi:hypothetical protein
MGVRGAVWADMAAAVGGLARRIPSKTVDVSTQAIGSAKGF